MTITDRTRPDTPDPTTRLVLDFTEHVLRLTEVATDLEAIFRTAGMLSGEDQAHVDTICDALHLAARKLDAVRIEADKGQEADEPTAEERLAVIVEMSELSCRLNALLGRTTDRFGLVDQGNMEDAAFALQDSAAALALDHVLSAAGVDVPL